MLKRVLKYSLFTLTVLAVIGIVGLYSFYSSVKNGSFGELPTDEQLKAIRNFQASDVYSEDGHLLGRYFIENRTHVDIAHVSPNIINALISTEDSRFYEHTGIDQRSLLRVLFKSVILGQRAGGGSTISQQLIKNLFGRENHGNLTMPVVKIKEGILANKLNELYSKDEILELYLNTVPFGEDTYGIGTACERFFSANYKEVSVTEAAVLIGMLKANTSYNPRLNPEKSLHRRNVVLGLMKNQNHLSEEECRDLQKQPIGLKYKREDINEGTAPYFRKYIKPEIASILKNIEQETGVKYDLIKDGLKIYTTLDYKIQKAAEKSVVDHCVLLTKKLRREAVKKLKHGDLNHIVVQELKKSGRFNKFKDNKLWLKELSIPVQTTIFTFEGKVDTLISPLDSTVHTICLMQSTYMATNPQKGKVLAYVGGVNFKHFPYDRVQAKRQVGSIFKPIIYSNALAHGKEICDLYKNQQIRYTQYDGWTPKNSDGKYGGKYSLIGALTNSINTVSVQLLMEAGISQTAQYCKTLGLTDSIPNVPSLALGSASIPLEKMIEVYSVFANNGKKQKIYSIEKIENVKGEVIYQHKQTLPSKVVESSVTDKLTRMLLSVTNKGTAMRLRSRYKFTNEIAGKTGTTQNQTDGWFIGYTPTFVAGVWTGADIPSIHFSGIANGQGANMALPIWAEIYKVILKDKELRSQYSQSFNIDINVDCPYYMEEKNDFIHRLFKQKGAKDNDSDGIETPEKRKGLFRKRKH